MLEVSRVTLLIDMVRARDGRVVAIRCSFCGLLFVNAGGRASQAHADHTWTHVTGPADVIALTERTAP